MFRCQRHAPVFNASVDSVGGDRRPLKEAAPVSRLAVRCRLVRTSVSLVHHRSEQDARSSGWIDLTPLARARMEAGRSVRTIAGRRAYDMFGIFGLNRQTPHVFSSGGGRSPGEHRARGSALQAVRGAGGSPVHGRWGASGVPHATTALGHSLVMCCVIWLCNGSFVWVIFRSTPTTPRHATTYITTRGPNDPKRPASRKQQEKIYTKGNTGKPPYRRDVL